MADRSTPRGERTARRAPSDREARLLAAGAALLAGPDSGLFGTLTARSVAAAAGVTTGSLYAHFDSLSGFEVRLADHIVEGGDGDRLAAFQAALDELVRSPPGWPTEQVLAALCRDQFRRAAGDDRFVLRSALAARHPPGAVARRLRARYRATTQQVELALEGVLDAWQVQAPPRLPVPRLAVAVTAVLEGLVLRSRVDAASVPPDVFGAVVLALIHPALAARRDDAGGAPPRPVTVGRPPVSGAPRRLVPFRGTLAPRRSELVDGAIEALAGRNFDEVTMNEVASRVGIGATSFYYFFPTKPALAAAVFARLLDGERRTALERLKSDEPLAVLKDYLHALAQVTNERRSLSSALLQGLRAHAPAARPLDRSYARPDRVRWDLLAPALPIDRALLDAAKRGQIKRPPELGRAAAMIAELVLVHVVTYPELTAHAVVDDVWLLTIEGLAAR